jgi:dienelactone hydrolase
MRKMLFTLLAFWIFLAALLPVGVQAQSSAICAQSVSVQTGDTLSSLARTYLGSLSAYPAIVDATNAAAAVDSRYAVIANPGVIRIGWLLCIPAANQTAASPQATPIRPTPIPTPSPQTGAGVDSDLLPAVDDPAEHPLAIAAMRNRDYPGSEITIERTLNPGRNYNRYVVSYDSDGLELDALLTVPTGAKPESGWPVIVFNHGYIPPTVYRTGERYVAYVDYIARNGYIVLAPDYRGHGFSEGTPASGHGSPDYTIDVLNAVSSMRRYADADPARIGLWGHSMGGGIVLRAMVVDEEIAAGVSWGGVVVSFLDSLERPDLQNVWVPTWFKEPRDQYLATYGTPDENPDFWTATSPNAFLADLSGPIQLHHAIADDSVPVEYSDVLADQINAAGGTVELFRYSGDNHNISVNFGTAMARTVAFFDQHVK